MNLSSLFSRSSDTRSASSCFPADNKRLIISFKMKSSLSGILERYLKATSNNCALYSDVSVQALLDKIANHGASGF